MSWSNIIHNKMRSFLTILGIIIGVGSIVALITILEGATNSISSEITAIGADRITVQAQGTPLKRGISNSDLQRISEIEHINGISPTLSTNTTIVYNGNDLESVTLQGKNQVYFQREPDILKMGRGINILDDQSKSKVAVIGTSVVDKLFYGVDPIGEEIIIQGISYQIIGVYEASTALSFGGSSDTVIIPYTTAVRALGIKNINNIDLYIDDSDAIEDVMVSLEAVLNEAFNQKENSYSIINFDELLSSFSQIMNMMSIMLAGIASISLVVGGIGIMNMMLVSVTERTSEIGLRKALGAEPKRIQQQFLLEAIFLSIIGGIIGLGIGMLLAWAALTAMGVALTFTMSTLLLAFGFSSGVGVLFGYMPARKASRLNPIDALRSI